MSNLVSNWRKTAIGVTLISALGYMMVFLPPATFEWLAQEDGILEWVCTLLFFATGILFFILFCFVSCSDSLKSDEDSLSDESSSFFESVSFARPEFFCPPFYIQVNFWHYGVVTSMRCCSTLLPCSFVTRIFVANKQINVCGTGCCLLNNFDGNNLMFAEW